MALKHQMYLSCRVVAPSLVTLQRDSHPLRLTALTERGGKCDVCDVGMIKCVRQDPFRKVASEVLSLLEGKERLPSLCTSPALHKASQCFLLCCTSSSSSRHWDFEDVFYPCQGEGRTLQEYVINR